MKKFDSHSHLENQSNGYDRPISPPFSIARHSSNVDRRKHIRVFSQVIESKLPQFGLSPIDSFLERTMVQDHCNRSEEAIAVTLHIFPSKS
mmetsp:Transcript_22470/g.32311  ORF Transcript_22470/g.32311 Transcript_22470/m.32311 type:complete len:91 (+) Transcript_22470:97-369(+)